MIKYIKVDDLKKHARLVRVSKLEMKNAVLLEDLNQIEQTEALPRSDIDHIADSLFRKIEFLEREFDNALPNLRKIEDEDVKSLYLAMLNALEWILKEIEQSAYEIRTYGRYYPGERILHDPEVINFRFPNSRRGERQDADKEQQSTK